MNTVKKSKLITLILPVLILLTEPASAADLYLNFFRNPSIGPEVKFEFVSFHTGYYTTIISKNGEGNNVSTEFIRTGVTFWPTHYLYLSASHLFGLNRAWKDKHGGIYESGVQWLIFDKRVALRLGVAVLPSSEFGTKINPTPGISFRISL